MSRPWMPLYISDYIGDTLHLTTTEHGAYLLLLFHYWQKECLPTTDEDLALITRLSVREWRKMKPKIQGFFGPDWRHKRVEAELVRAAEKYERRANAGRAGGNAKAAAAASGKQSPGNAKSDDLALPGLRTGNARSSRVAMPRNNSGNALPTTTTSLRESRAGKEVPPTSQDRGRPPTHTTPAPAPVWDDHAPFGSDDGEDAA